MVELSAVLAMLVAVALGAIGFMAGVVVGRSRAWADAQSRPQNERSGD